jgi:hypothetical protein
MESVKPTSFLGDLLPPFYSLKGPWDKSELGLLTTYISYNLTIKI